MSIRDEPKPSRDEVNKARFTAERNVKVEPPKPFCAEKIADDTSCSDDYVDFDNYHFMGFFTDKSTILKVASYLVFFSLLALLISGLYLMVKPVKRSLDTSGYTTTTPTPVPSPTTTPVIDNTKGVVKDDVSNALSAITEKLDTVSANNTNLLSKFNKLNVKVETTKGASFTVSKYYAILSAQQNLLININVYNTLSLMVTEPSGKKFLKEELAKLYDINTKLIALRKETYKTASKDDREIIYKLYTELSDIYISVIPKEGK